MTESPAASAASRPVSPNGRVGTIDHGDYRATVAEVGGGLHSLSYRGRDLVVTWPVDIVRPTHRGAVLAPWPNRIRDGQYEWDGVTQQLPLTEPDKHNAIHGLSSWLAFMATDEVPDRLELTGRIWAQKGYPFVVDVTVVYRLDDDGLHWDVTGSNRGDSPAPYGCSVHPYLVAGPGHVDDWTLLVPAGRYLTVDAERLLPETVEPVPDAFDFRTPRPIGDTELDYAYTDLTGDTVEVRTADGSGVALSFGSDLHWLQVHTADRPEPEQNRIGMAIEPMTCPPDAFRSGTDLLVLAPGESHTTSLRISALP